MLLLLLSGLLLLFDAQTSVQLFCALLDGKYWT
jgi:hypothetical protein